MKHARPPLAPSALRDPAAWLTTRDAASLLRVHPKHIYRLLRRGLPGHRVGGEWRFFAPEILEWSEAPLPPKAPLLPPLLAANGDLAVERLLAGYSRTRAPPLGFVRADMGEGLRLLAQGAALVTGAHGEAPARAHPTDDPLVSMHLVERRVGLALRPGVRLPDLRHLRRLRVASRPPSAGVRRLFDRALREAEVDPAALHARALLLSSHREVACAVARGEFDVGLATMAWAREVGLGFLPLALERYGLVLRASSLRDPRVRALCAMAKSPAFRRELAAIEGYDPRHAGTLTQSDGTPIVSLRAPAAPSKALRPFPA